MFSRRVRFGCAFGRVALLTLRLLLTGLPCKILAIELGVPFFFSERRGEFVIANRTERALIFGRGRNSILEELPWLGSGVARLRQIGWLDRSGT